MVSSRSTAPSPARSTSLGRNGAPFAVAEWKLDDDQTLWNILKVARALRLLSVKAAYVVAGPPWRWGNQPKQRVPTSGVS
jgi:hypothetical protein